MKGKFRPNNPSKYLGDPTNIVYRSSWELKFCKWLDENPNVVQWASEEFSIPYRSPIDNRVHRYFPDFLVKKKSPDGKIECVVVEIKPKGQTKAPKVQSKPTRRYLQEVMTYGINTAKWKYAQEYCDDRGWKFMVLTEDHLNIKF